MNAEKIEYNSKYHELGDWEEIAEYEGRYYGPDGNELGTIPISIAPVLDIHTDDVLGWLVAETPDEDTIYHGVYSTEAEAKEAARKLAEKLDETPVLDDVIADIAAVEYFDNPKIIPLVVDAMTQYSQGYLLITPGIREPIGTRWTTNGYLQCDHLAMDATYDSREVAAEALLRAVRAVSCDGNDDYALD